MKFLLKNLKGSGRFMHLIDLHVHIDFYSDPVAIANSYEKRKIYTLFVTNLPEVYGIHYKSFSVYKYVRLCLGYHPHLAGEHELNRSIFEKYIKSTKYIGEVGLDFQGESPYIIKKQINNFEYITNPNINRGRIFTIHSKKAEDEVLKILKTNQVKHAIFHWYSGKLSTMNEIIEEGYYFSINYRMLKSNMGRKIISKIPSDRILFETDGPFIRYQGSVCTPDNLKSIYKEFDELIPNFMEVVFNNFKRLLIEKDLSTRIDM